MKLEEMANLVCHRSMASSNPIKCVGDKCMKCCNGKSAYPDIHNQWYCRDNE